MSHKIIERKKGYWLYYSITSTLCITAIYLIYKSLGDKINSSIILIYMFIIEALILSFIIYKREISVKLSKQTFILVLIAALIAVMSNTFVIKAISLAPNPGYHAGVASFATILVTLSSIFLFKSELNTRRILGIVLAIIGISIIGFT